MNIVIIRVTTYSGHKGAERPVSFTLGERTLDVTEVVDRWYGPDHEYFKLRADDGCVYIIRYDRSADEWELTMMESGEGGEGPVA